MSELATHTHESRTAAHDAADSQNAPSAGHVRQLISQGRGDPQQIAALVRANPRMQHEVFAFLQAVLGNGYVQAVLRLLGAGPEAQAAPAAHIAKAPATSDKVLPLGPVRVTASMLNIRSTPDAEAKDNIVGGLRRGKVVTAVAQQGEWLVIDYQGEKAFVHGDYVRAAHRRRGQAEAQNEAQNEAHDEHGEGAEHTDAAPKLEAAETSEPRSVDVAPAPVADVAPAPTADVAPAPTAAPTVAHTAPTPAPAKPAGKAKETIRRKKNGYAKYGGGAVRDVLTRLVESGQLHITGNQIAVLDAVAQVETGGQIGCVQTYDDQVVSIGFKQVVLGHGSLEKIMKKAPAGFAKHGLALDTSKTYEHPGWKKPPHQIAGCDDEELLRTEEWGNKFYEASMEPDVVAAMCELALGEAGKVDAAVDRSAPDCKFFDDLTAQAWLLETINNRPAYMPKAVSRAVDDGAKGATTRDRFLDILSGAIVETYVIEEPLLFYNKALKKLKKPPTPEQDAKLLADAKAKYASVGRRKGTNIVTKISRHLKAPEIASTGKADKSADAPAPAPLPVIAPAPTAVVDDHDEGELVTEAHVAHAPPADHAEAPKPEPVHVAKPEATQDAKHETKPEAKPEAKPAAPEHKPELPAPVARIEQAAPEAAKQAPKTPDPTPTDKVSDVFSAVYLAGLKGQEQYTQVYASPGGITENPDVFLFLHGHVAQYNIDPKQKQKDVNGVRTRLSGKDTALEAMTHARGKNTVVVMPQGKVGDHAAAKESGDERQEGGYMKAIVAGLPSFLESVLGKLGADLGKEKITPKHIGIAGHSAGGYEGIEQTLKHAGDLYDTISDITLMDTGYGAPEHFQLTRDWMLQGKPGKNVRIVAQAGQLDNAEQGYKVVFSRQKLEKACAAAGDGFTVEHLAWNDKPTKEMRTMQHSRILQHGKPHADVLVLKYWDDTGDGHHNLRDHTLDDAILSIGEGEEGNEDFGQRDHGVEAVEYSNADETTDQKAKPGSKSPAPAPKAAPKPKAGNETPAPKAAKPKAAKVEDATHTKKKYDSVKGVDSFGNQTERTGSRTKHVAGANERVFANSFTTMQAADVFTSSTGNKKLPNKLPAGTVLHVQAVTGDRAQIVTPDISAEKDLWIDFANLGGKSVDPAKAELGNEFNDGKDKERADAIRLGLPGGRSPGKSQFSWKFGGNFAPSYDGVSLDGSLMSKVSALMDWAIANDMVTKDIVIGEGMRSPARAHFLCVRYEIAKNGLKNVSLDTLKALKDGRDHLGHLWYKPGWTEEEIIANAQNMYGKGAHGTVAAAGYEYGDDRRAPLLKNEGPKVTFHASGHAVDVNIPWRGKDDPTKTDLWGYEEIYHQFGLTRPLHIDRGVAKKLQEPWHIEETGKKIDGDLDDDSVTHG